VQYATVVLPTTAFGEEQVSFTSTERRIQLAEQVIEPAAVLTPAWEQIARVARLMGANWNYPTAADVMEEIREAVPIYSGAAYDNLAREYGRQWPCTKDRPLGTPFLFAEENGEKPFQFVPVPRPSFTRASKEFPLTLVFGNSLYYWNQNVLIRNSETLKREYRILSLDYPDGFVELNPDDASEAGIRDGKKIRLRGQSGSAVSTARVTKEVRKGTVFVPYFERELEKQIRGASEESSTVLPVRVEKESA